MDTLKSYRDLEVWKLAREASVKVHAMSLRLPKFELYEEGSQIRRASKSIRHNIVEGYGRRRYQMEFVKPLTYALASCDETRDILETLWETQSLTDNEVYQELLTRLDHLGRMLNKFHQAVQQKHRSIA